MKQAYGISVLLGAVLLSACGEKPAAPPSATDTKPNTVAEQVADPKPAAPAETAEAKPAVTPPLPADAPAPGTPAPASEPLVGMPTEPTVLPDGTLELRWEHLVPQGYEPETIMAKYAAQIDQITEGSPEDDALMEKIMAEFNTAPSNASLGGKRVRLPGFISPLDEKDGIVSEFLLVPYFGACIHQPPPPVNQTLLVRPLADKSVEMDAIYEPVWVTGDLKVENTKTSLASAGYLIENAQLEPYTEEDAAADEAAEQAAMEGISPEQAAQEADKPGTPDTTTPAAKPATE